MKKRIKDKVFQYFKEGNWDKHLAIAGVVYIIVIVVAIVWSNI